VREITESSVSRARGLAACLQHARVAIARHRVRRRERSRACEQGVGVLRRTALERAPPLERQAVRFGGARIRLLVQPGACAIPNVMRIVGRRFGGGGGVGRDGTFALAHSIAGGAEQQMRAGARAVGPGLRR
jgi:hypothetical protein